MRYVAARAVEHSELVAYRRYLTDAAMVITKNMASSERAYMTMRYADILAGKKPPEEESADAIIDRVRKGVSGAK